MSVIYKVWSPPRKKGADLQGFTPDRAHLLLQKFYGDFLHHSDGTHLSGGVPDDTTWKIRWRRLAAQSDIWYSMPLRKVGRRFTAVLATEWHRVLDGTPPDR